MDGTSEQEGSGGRETKQQQQQQDASKLKQDKSSSPSGKSKEEPKEGSKSQQARSNDDPTTGPSTINAGSDSRRDRPVAGATDQPRPRRPRPLRPNQFRMVALAAGAAGRGPGERVPIIEPTTNPPTLVGVPIEAQIELASGVLQPAGRATMVPPKRPNYPPAAAARHFAGEVGPAPSQAAASYALHHHHHRFQPATSLGATALTSGSGNKPNRYSWAQMQQWHAAQSAAAAAAVAGDATGAAGGVGGGAAPTGGFHYHLPTPFSSAASRVLVVPNPIVNLSEHTKSRLIKFIEAIKRFSEKWFSHVLLLLFLASYACFGAYIFISFEAPNEQWEKQLIIDTRLRIVNETYDLALESGQTRESFVDSFRTKFEDYERLLNRACANGMTSNSLENQWTFWGALFYSMTVFTTIGYGHLTPVTFAGRVATMIYAIFGIPILLMVLADLGKLLTRIIKYAFKKFRYWYNKLLGRKASVRTRKLITDNTNQYIGHARHAFERGFASYIQPYQSRLPNAFLREFRSKNEPSEQATQAQAQAHEHEHEHEMHEHRQQQPPKQQQQDSGGLESSDVIITPAKQTKPVSPQIDGEHAIKDHPPPQLAAEKEEEKDRDKDQDQDQRQPDNKHHSQQQQQSQASKQKEKFKRSRKASSSQKPTTSTGTTTSTTTTSDSASQRRASQKHSVTRSQSSTNVDKAPTAPETSAKRSSLDQQQPTTNHSDPSATDLEAGGSGSVFVGQDEHGHHGHLGGRLHPDEHEEFVDELDEDLDIPVSFALFLLITYMMFGAVVFSIWESWNFFDSLYFVFISMSTIGFGDLVPQHPKRMIGTFAYLLFGLALTSMCINVVQEKIHATFLRAKMQIGEKMGFDLDQIMADDYYHEGGSAFGDDPDEQLDENGSYANSVALSQTNSATMASELGAGGGQPPAVSTAGADGSAASASASDSQTSSQQVATVAPQPATGEPLPAAAMSRSKSKESLKWKKRSLSGAGGLHSSSTDQHSIGASCKRKTSSGSKKAPPAGAQARQQHHQQAHQQHHHQQQPQQQASKEARQEGQPLAGPIKHQVEIIRMLNVPVMLQQLEERPASRGPPLAQTRANPSINQPIDGGVRAFCEPLRRAFQAGQRPKLVASRSQPSSPYHHHHLNGSHTSQAQPERALSSGTPSPRPTTDQQQHLYQHHRGRGRLIDLGSCRRNGRAADTMTRSLTGSRRASVSDELNQLDDLIVGLSKSPPERFGPLLGIPSSRSSRSSRSNSPANQLALSAASSAGHTTPTTRRGTSMMVRGSSDSVGGPRRPLSRLAQEKQRSFNSTTNQTPPFLTPSGSSNLLANDMTQQQQQHHHQQLHRTDQGRRKSSSSSGASRFAMANSARQSSNELNLCESQAALDELEAVRFSAV